MAEKKDRMNCWQFWTCGREKGGPRAAELGPCPAAREHRLHGVNGGANGGRACWIVPGTLCGGKEQGTYAAKIGECSACGFYRHVRDEERSGLVRTRNLLQLIF